MACDPSPEQAPQHRPAPDHRQRERRASRGQPIGLDEDGGEIGEEPKRGHLIAGIRAQHVPDPPAAAHGPEPCEERECRSRFAWAPRPPDPLQPPDHTDHQAQHPERHPPAAQIHEERDQRDHEDHPQKTGTEDHAARGATLLGGK
jgi:hypothetical protein